MATLMLLDEVMKKTHRGLPPHQVFDVIGGTSTGGYALGCSQTPGAALDISQSLC